MPSREDMLREALARIEASVDQPEVSYNNHVDDDLEY